MTAATPPPAKTNLVQVWGLVADLGFADLLLLTPTGNSWTIIEQVRPTTHQTLYPDDLIGVSVQVSQRPSLGDPRLTTMYVDANAQAFETEVPIRSRAIRLPNGTILLSEEALETGRRRGRLERAYLELFDQLCTMLRLGQFPFAEEFEPLESQRVGDGVVVFDHDGLVRFASPNATSAMHRLGVKANIEGRSLPELGLRADWLARIPHATHPINGELTSTRTDAVSIGLVNQSATSSRSEQASSTMTVVATYLLPLIDGSALLLRDVTDVRRRDRLIVSKDATIREVHHRVKNNLQTISALLRLQGRRLASSEAKEAIEESVRRIRSMALVHETLSQGVSSTVPFHEVIRPLVRIVEEGLQGADRPVRFHIGGHAGELPAEIATPLAIVLVELLQNSVEHGFPSSQASGAVTVQFDRTADQLRVTVSDNGVGFPPGFSLSTSKSLGLTIVRTLITSELAGVISTTTDVGAVVDLRIPLVKDQL